MSHWNAFLIVNNDLEGKDKGDRLNCDFSSAFGCRCRSIVYHEHNQLVICRSQIVAPCQTWLFISFCVLAVWFDDS